MKKLLLIMIMVLLVGCDKESIQNEINNKEPIISLEYVDINSPENYNIHLQNFEQMDLYIFGLKSKELFTYDMTIGYKTFRFGEVVVSNDTFRSYKNNTIDDNYISFILSNITDKDSRDTDTWNVILRMYNESGYSSTISTRQFKDFPVDYLSKQSGYPHSIQIESGKDITLINFLYFTDHPYSFSEENGEIINKQEIDFLISWYVRIDNIEVIDK